MAHSPTPPAVPPKPSRPRAFTTSISSQAQPNRSPSVVRTYQQPTGTGAHSRASSSVLNLSTRSRSDSTTTLSSAKKGKRKAIFCDVVFEDLRFDQNGQPVGSHELTNFIHQLGSSISLPEAGPSRSHTPRASTPGKDSKVNLAAVRQNLLELAETETNYLVKLKSLNQDFAVPLRMFAKQSSTAIISAFHAAYLFSNVEQLVPISEAFQRDLNSMAQQMKKYPQHLPRDFGDMILRHVERMEPFKKWLGGSSRAEAVRQHLERTNPSFVKFIQATQNVVRESTQQTAGFREFLAEPFQRISRYRLMLDPIVKNLPQSDPNLEPLQIAISTLSEICSMRLDDQTRKAAIFWSLSEAIDGFPAHLVDSKRSYIDCIDVDEFVEPSEGKSSFNLRCILFLFNDKIVIAKRPTGDKTGKDYCGLNDFDALVSLYEVSELSNSQANLIGSPKKLKKAVLGFRGLIDLSELSISNIGAQNFTFQLDRPPMDQNERWIGRRTRNYVLPYAQSDSARKLALNNFIESLLVSQTRSLLRAGAFAAKRSEKLFSNDEIESTTEIFWSLWSKNQWETQIGTKRSKLALQVAENGTNPQPLRVGSDGLPLIWASAHFVGNGQANFSVSSRPSEANAGTEIIPLHRIPHAIAEIGSSTSLCNAMTSLPPSPNLLSRSRPRSGIFSVAADLFNQGVGMKRNHSINSKASTTLSAPSTPKSPANRIPSLGAASLGNREERAKKLFQKSAPNLFASVSSAADKYAIDYDTSAADESMTSCYSDVPRRRVESHRRSSSLPASAHLDPDTNKFSPEESEIQAENVVPRDHVTSASEAWARVQQLDDDVNSFTSPISYRAPVKRRMLGPREMGNPATKTPSPTSRLEIADTLPYAQNISPDAIRRSSASTSPDSSLAHSVKRPLAETASPRTSPAKKQISVGEGFPRGPSPSSAQIRSRIASSGAGARQFSAGSARRIVSAQRSRRIASGTSTIRPDSPPLVENSSPKPDSVQDLFSPSRSQSSLNYELEREDDVMDPLQQIRQHVKEFQRKLSNSMTNKENERISTNSPTGLSRSPHTRNISLKANLGSTALAQAYSESRKSTPSPFDVPSSLCWAEKLTDLLNQLENSAAVTPILPSRPSETEFLTLEAERDVLSAELQAVKQELEKKIEQENSIQANLDTAQAQNYKLRTAYNDILGEVNTLYDEFNSRISEVVQAMQVDATSGDTGYNDMSTELKDAVIARVNAERELSQFRARVAEELREKEEWANLLRQHDLIKS